MKIVLHGAPPLPDVQVVVGPVLPLPFSPAQWEAQVLAATPSATLRFVSREEQRLAAGWPLVLIHSEIDLAAGTLARLHGFYRILHLGAVVTLSGRGPWSATHLHDMRGFLARARHDLTTPEVASEHAIWEGLPHE